TTRAAHPVKAEEPGVYLHLYEVVPNPALRNEVTPERAADGTVVRRPRLALDLDYLVTFVGDAATFDGERLAGVVMGGLHEMPPLGPPEIAELVATLPASHVLTGADLAEQVEHVRLTHVPMDLEEQSRLWSMLGIGFHRLSVTYRASVVLVDAEVTPAPAAPVTRPAVATLPLRAPDITGVTSSARPLAVVAPGEDVVIRGQALRGEVTLVAIGGHEIDVPDAADELITIPAAAVTALPRGLAGVQVIHRATLPDGTTRGAAASGAVPLALVPAITLPRTTPTNATLDGAPGHRIRVAVDPVPEADQDVELVLSGLAGAPSRTVSTGEADGGEVRFTTAPRLPAGRYLVRVSVDGAVSVLPTDPATGELTTDLVLEVS
ncbi:MAG TPA: DUF4255 domain-containing protein, partial [Iamia sp.]|nr:DUF4255 domain-containing protein [Iamia sp.]